jgi:hypothetical protein
LDGSSNCCLAAQGWAGFCYAPTLPEGFKGKTVFFKPGAVASVFSDGPAEAAGLVVGDVLLTVNGVPTSDEERLVKLDDHYLVFLAATTLFVVRPLAYVDEFPSRCARSRAQMTWHQVVLYVVLTILGYLESLVELNRASPPTEIGLAAWN